MKKIIRFLPFIVIYLASLAIGYSYTASPADWRDQVFYMVMVDRFYNGDSSNDNFNSNYAPSNWSNVHGGDLKGITNKLDYLKTLGVSALWISPVPTNDGQYHGYAAVNWKEVDPRIGTMSDLSTLIVQAHSKGIYVFLDIVCNHMGFRVSQPSGNWNYPTGYTLSWANSSKKNSPAPFDNLSSFHNYGNIANFGDTNQVELGWLSGLNDIKTEDYGVQTTLIEIYKWWIQQTDCDGFRIDTFKHVNIGFWQAFCPEIYSYASTLGKNNFLMYGEVYDGNESKVGYYTGTKAGGAYVLKSVLYYPMYYTMNNVFAYGQNTKLLDDEYGQLTNYDTTTWDYEATFIDNHDQARFLSPSHANNDYNKLKLAMTFMLTSRGVPIIYYGTEQGFYGETDPFCREDMWAGQCKDTNFAGQDSFNTNFSLFQFTSTLLYLRNQYTPLRRGTYTSRWNNGSSAGIYAYSRIYNNQEMVVILNTATSTQTTKSGGTGIVTTFPQNTLLTNLLSTSESVIVGANGVATNQIAVVMPAQSIKILSSFSISTLPPLVTSTNPTSGQINVPLNQVLSVTFNEGMDPNSVQSAFSILPSVPGTFSWNSYTLSYTPSSSLAGNQLYTVTISSSAFSVNTIYMQDNYSFNFTTLPKDDFAGPVISNITPSNGTTLVNIFSPTLKATITDAGSGVNPNTLIMTLDNVTVLPSFDSNSGLLTYTPGSPLSAGVHQFTIDIQDNEANFATQAFSRFTVIMMKIMDGNFSANEWSASELKTSNASNPWGPNNLIQLYVSGDSQYLYVGVVGTTDTTGNNVIGVYVDVPTITTGTSELDYYQGMKATNFDPDFMYADYRMEKDPNFPGGCVRKIYSNGSTSLLGTSSTNDCGALSPSLNTNGLGGIEFRIPWSVTSGANQYSTIKVAAWMAYALSSTPPYLPNMGLGGGSKDELGGDSDNNGLTVETPWTGTAATLVPIDDWRMYTRDTLENKKYSTKHSHN